MEVAHRRDGVVETLAGDVVEKLAPDAKAAAGELYLRLALTLDRRDRIAEEMA